MKNTSKEAEIFRKAIFEEDVGFLSWLLFKFQLTEGQEAIVRTIAFSKHRRVCINCMTRYGKSRCVAIGAALFILFNKDKKIAIIAPTLEQTGIIRNYFAEHVIASPLLADLVEFEKDNSFTRLKREASRKRMTFKNGCELRILSAHQEAEGLMGFGADVVIKDESCLIGRSADTKIMRMLGDQAESSILIELANPWDTDNTYYEHWNNANFQKIHIGWQQALKEGRTTKEFIEEMKAYMTPIEFTVLYESKFPEQSEDSLFAFDKINKMFENDFAIFDGKKIISCDVADKGKDKTVIMYGYCKDSRYKLEKIYSEAQSENTDVANRIIQWYREYGADIINIDTIGVGVGVVSRIKEVLGDQSVRINACHFGEKPEEDHQPTSEKALESKARFQNKKAQQYFRLRQLLENGLIDAPFDLELKKQLMSMKWEINRNTKKISIVDPEDKSPDFADALVYFIWKQESELSFFFG